MEEKVNQTGDSVVPFCFSFLGGGICGWYDLVKVC